MQHQTAEQSHLDSLVQGYLKDQGQVGSKAQALAEAAIWKAWEAVPGNKKSRDNGFNRKSVLKQLIGEGYHHTQTRDAIRNLREDGEQVFALLDSKRATLSAVEVAIREARAYSQVSGQAIGYVLPRFLGMAMAGQKVPKVKRHNGNRVAARSFRDALRPLVESYLQLRLDGAHDAVVKVAVEKAFLAASEAVEAVVNREKVSLRMARETAVMRKTREADKAARILGLEASPVPDLNLAKKAKRAKAREQHPDIAGDAGRVGFEESIAAYNAYEELCETVFEKGE